MVIFIAKKQEIHTRNVPVFLRGFGVTPLRPQRESSPVARPEMDRSNKPYLHGESG
jgi:hypothetical protein